MHVYVCGSGGNVTRNDTFRVTVYNIQLFQLTLSDQNKAKRQDRNVLWDYFL